MERAGWLAEWASEGGGGEGLLERFLWSSPDRSKYGRYKNKRFEIPNLVTGNGEVVCVTVFFLLSL